MKFPLERVINTGLRGLTLVSKFLLIFVLVKLLAPADVAVYGLIAATVGYALMALGMDFYTHATRSLIGAVRGMWAGMLRDQAVFYLLSYLVLLPLALLLFQQGLLPWSMALWFFSLLAAEHLAQELNRLLVAMREPLWASWVMFIRHGLWAVAIAALMWLVPGTRSLSTVFGAWLIGSVAASLLALWPLRRLERGSLQNKINWAWIRTGIKAALPFAFATLCLRATYTADRYLIDMFNGVEVVAAYVLFVGIGNAVMSFLDAGVFSFQYPKLVAAASQGDGSGFRSENRLLWRNTLVATGVLTIAAFVCTPPVVAWLDRPSYLEHIGLLSWVLLAIAFTALGMVPHYALFARHKDRVIIAAHVLSLPVFFLFAWLLRPALGSETVAAAVTASAAFIFLFKLTAYLNGSRAP